MQTIFKQNLIRFWPLVPFRGKVRRKVRRKDAWWHANGGIMAKDEEDQVAEEQEVGVAVRVKREGERGGRRK